MEFVHKVDMDGLSGSIYYRVPLAQERYRLAKECAFRVVDGELKEMHRIEQAEMLMIKIKDFVTKVDCVAGDLKIDNFDLLSMDSRGSEALQELGAKLLNGTLLGKP